jgi:23S rRNA (uracil1939-C5)-methyltransferase
MERYTVIPEKIVFGGSCLARINGKNVFIPYAIPGEKIEIEIKKTFRDYDLAEITQVLEPSPHRVHAFCPLYGKCGGCNMQHIDISFQRELRKNMLKECFEREGIDCPEIEIISGEEKGYRSRIQLTDGGFNEKQSNKIIKIDFCPVATQEINSYLSSNPFETRPQGRVHFFGDKRIISSSASPSGRLVIADETKKELWNKHQIGKSKNKTKNKVKQRFAGSFENSSNNCTVQINNKSIEFDVQGFFQSNMEVLEKTINAVTFNMGGQNVLDMYSGAGTFSIFLADLFKKTTLVEHNRDALVHAEKNLLGKNHETYGLSGAKWVTQNASSILKKDGQYDAVVIDPPRSGMEKEVCRWLCQNKTPQIRSVSCDPSTHARDASYLVKAGYKLTKLYLLDFYPQTSHIESLAYFEYI